MTTPHDLAMSLAAEAQLLAMAGRDVAAREKLESAARHEQEAADRAEESAPRTRGILRVSAVSLWFQAGRPDLKVQDETVNGVDRMRNRSELIRVWRESPPAIPPRRGN